MTNRIPIAVASSIFALTFLVAPSAIADPTPPSPTATVSASPEPAPGIPPAPPCVSLADLNSVVATLYDTRADLATTARQAAAESRHVTRLEHRIKAKDRLIKRLRAQLAS